jgi:CheY-like chemotaxis protein
MGGNITFESESGVGTTFVITIPFKINSEIEQCEDTQEFSLHALDGFNILLVEDNELNMEIAEFSLQNAGAKITKAWNGQEAVEIFQASSIGDFDVILMDVMMPVMDGYEATKTIRALSREDAKTIPIIAMTANAFSEDKIKAEEAGMNEHIAKPINMKLLIRIVSKLVNHT